MSKKEKFQSVQANTDYLRPMLDQLNIALLNRLGGHIVMDVEEIDATGDWDMLIGIDDKTMKYEFRLVRSSKISS